MANALMSALHGALAPVQKQTGTLRPVDNRGGWWGIIREAYAGAWQRNEEIRIDTVLTYSAVFRCISLASSDVGKCRLKLVKQTSDDIWVETDSGEGAAFIPVIRKPNSYQNRIQFYSMWVISKLVHGNAYILKERDNRGVVRRMHVLDPCRVTPLVAPNGDVYYQLQRDDLAQVTDDLPAVPAREMIHDRWNTLYHPLVGLSPIYACGMAAVQGLNIQNSQSKFFANGAQPSGILTAPSSISQEVADRLKEAWATNYTGENAGKTAVLGDGLEYKQVSVNAVDAQLIEQLKWSAETVCSVFGVPAYMAGVGQAPAYNNIEALRLQYYAQCLQTHFESIELCLDEGLELPKPYGTEFDLDDLLRMDTSTLVEAESKAVTAGIKKPDESRKRLNLPPVPGGNTPYLQEQNYSLAALAKRDALENPFGAKSPTEPAPAVPAAPAPAVEEDGDGEDVARFLSALKTKFTEAAIHG
jgi:HK97 family phage portal protein